MGGPYNIPRNYKGENKILFVFSTKAFAYTAIGGFIGVVFFYLLKAIGLTVLGAIILILLALLGFIIGTFKIPETNSFELTRKVGGEPIDDIIKRLIKYKRNGKRIYIYKEEAHKDGK